MKYYSGRLTRALRGPGVTIPQLTWPVLILFCLLDAISESLPATLPYFLLIVVLLASGVFIQVCSFFSLLLCLGRTTEPTL